MDAIKGQHHGKLVKDRERSRELGKDQGRRKEIKSAGKDQRDLEKDSRDNIKGHHQVTTSRGA
ncbi:MAG: hypothetical protein BYD32DRAFT_405540 [Podila humilis]|nr:MAG: hypothetical protein BYD32DRAFT_405540 [Podila humilis]